MPEMQAWSEASDAKEISRYSFAAALVSYHFVVAPKFVVDVDHQDRQKEDGLPALVTCGQADIVPRAAVPVESDPQVREASVGSLVNADGDTKPVQRISSNVRSQDIPLPRVSGGGHELVAGRCEPLVLLGALHPRLSLVDTLCL